MKIITLTLNPAYDIHLVSDTFKIYEETIADIESFEAGGKGINISRALKYNDIDSTAIVVLGNENKEQFIKKLKEDSIIFEEINVNGRIRENITIHPNNDNETRLSFKGFKLVQDIIPLIKDRVYDVDDNTIITITGSNPEGLDKDKFISLLKQFKKNGAKLVIDSKSFKVDNLIDIKPWLIKPNESEIISYYNLVNPSLKEMTEITSSLFYSGIENVMISLGKNGAILRNNDGLFKVNVKHVKVLSTVGAGDSAIAGFIKGYALGMPTVDLLKYSMAFGTAKVKRSGTLPPLKNDVDKILKDINVERIN